MGLTDALFAGTSGLKGLGHGMSVIGDNVANLNTTAFKGARISFSDVMAQSINTASGSGQLGRGATVQALYPTFGQGSFESTANPTDLAIAGNGFFIVREPGSTGNVFYTRDGQFSVDKNGYLVNPAGFRVQGWRIDENTGDITGAITDIQIARNSEPVATSKIDVITNLDAREELETELVQLAGDIDGTTNTVVVKGGVDGTAATTIDADIGTGEDPLTAPVEGDIGFIRTIIGSDGDKYIVRVALGYNGSQWTGEVRFYDYRTGALVDSYDIAGTSDNTIQIGTEDSAIFKKYRFVLDLSQVDTTAGTDSGQLTNHNDFALGSSIGQETVFVARDLNGEDKKIWIGLAYNASTRTWSYKIKEGDATGTVIDSQQDVTVTRATVQLSSKENITIDWSNLGHISTETDTLFVPGREGLIEVKAPSDNPISYNVWIPYDFTVKDANGNTVNLRLWIRYQEDGRWDYYVMQDPGELSSSVASPTEDTGTILAQGSNWNMPEGDAQKSIRFFLNNTDQEIHIEWSGVNPIASDYASVINVYGTYATDTTLFFDYLGNTVGIKHDGTNWQYSLDNGTTWNTATVNNADIDGDGNNEDYFDITVGTSTIQINLEYLTNVATDGKLSLINGEHESYNLKEIASLYNLWNATNETPLPSTAYAYRTTLTIYDSLGTPHEITIYYDRTTRDNVYEFLVTCSPNEDQRDFIRDIEYGEMPSSNNGTPMYWLRREGDAVEEQWVQSSNTVLRQKRGVLMYGRMEFDNQGNIKNFYETYRIDPDTGNLVLLFDQEGNPITNPEDGFEVLGENGYPIFLADFLGLSLDQGTEEQITANRNSIQKVELNTGYYYKDGQWRGESVRTTQYATSNSTIFYDQNGFGPGYLETVSVDTDGVITGHYSNGRVIPLWMVSLANFNAPEQLDKVGNNLFRETTESGPPVTGKPRTNGLGSIAPNSLEQSNVDLGEQFVKMIIFQRGFQADARIITVTDTMLDELINLKR